MINSRRVLLSACLVLTVLFLALPVRAMPLATNGAPTAIGVAPIGLALEGSNVLLIDSVSNDVIWLANRRDRTISMHGRTIGAGQMAIVAGNKSAGFSGDGRAAVKAALQYPSGIAVDRAGNLYIADSSNNRVREVQAGSGIITTVAGNGSPGCTSVTTEATCFGGDGGPATKATLDTPAGVALDRAGNLYIADPDNYRVREVHAGSGLITTVAGNGT